MKEARTPLNGDEKRHCAKVALLEMAAAKPASYIGGYGEGDDALLGEFVDFAERYQLKCRRLQAKHEAAEDHRMNSD